MLRVTYEELELEGEERKPKTEGHGVAFVRQPRLFKSCSRPDGPVVIILASGSEVRGFDLGRVRWIFQSVKILSLSSFGKEVKPYVPCRIFTARK